MLLPIHMTLNMPDVLTECSIWASSSMIWVSQQQQGGHSNTSVVHMRDHRNVQKAWFWDWKWFARIAIMGQNMSVFNKKGPFWILLGGI